jgi:hypothetical protein
MKTMKNDEMKPMTNDERAKRESLTTIQMRTPNNEPNEEAEQTSNWDVEWPERAPVSGTRCHHRRGRGDVSSVPVTYSLASITVAL